MLRVTHKVCGRTVNPCEFGPIPKCGAKHFLKQHFGRSMKRNNLYVYGGGALAIIFALIWVYTSFFMNGDTVNQLERKAFISHGSDKYEVTILNGNGVLKVYQTVSKVTSETEKGYYYFWATVNGKRVYIQSPIGLTLIEEK